MTQILDTRSAFGILLSPGLLGFSATYKPLLRGASFGHAVIDTIEQTCEFRDRISEGDLIITIDGQRLEAEPTASWDQTRYFVISRTSTNDTHPSNEEKETANPLPRTSIRGMVRENDTMMDELTRREGERASNPEVRARAYRRAFGEGLTALPIGVGSSPEKRNELVASREKERERYKPRRVGENARTITQQVDPIARGAVHRLLRSFGSTVDTLHCPAGDNNNLTHQVFVVEFQNVQDSNSTGGRHVAKKTPKPVINVYGKTQAGLEKALGGIAHAIDSNIRGTECPVNYTFHAMDNGSMKHTIDEYISGEKAKRAKGSRMTRTNQSII